MDLIAEQLLQEGNYQELAEFYEEAIENDPSALSYYCYLSLAYLLQEKEEEAQGIWLSLLAELEEEQLEELTTKLVDILEQEAQRQVISNNNHHLAWVLRSYIKELYPSYINNLLHLVQLEIILSTSEENYLQQLQELIELLKQNPESLDKQLLRKVLLKVVNIIGETSIEFAQVSLPLLEEKQQVIENILKIAEDIAYEQKYVLYGIDLTKVCLEYDPDSLLIIKQLYWLYVLVKNYDQALELAERFYKKSQTKINKIFGTHKKLNVHLLRADWLKVLPLARQHKELITELSQEENAFVEDYLKDSLILLTQCLLYLEDNPQENRPLQNYIAKLFQENLPQTTPAVTISHQAKTQSAKLRIGYIGHTLRTHSVGWLSRWLLHYHDKENFQVGVYLLNQPEDLITEEWFKPSADFFHNFQRNTKGLIQQIQQDNINILVDLDSMTLNLTCEVLAAKPAPIQATWLGLDASGLPQIDYFIADPYVLPEDAQNYYQEKIWRLPKTYLAINGFEVAVPTRRREDLEIPPEGVIYFNMQGALKRHPDTIRLQMRILKAVSNSYLIIKGFADEEITKNLYTHLASEEGVSPDKLRFLPLDKTEEIHRANLALADVVLDTYPYNGATTTLEVLWMGIPLVTKVGEQFAARNSYTFMVNAGLSEGIAFTDEEYIEWGIKYGTDEALREQVKTKLRRSRSSSPLWNAREFTREMEKAYQQMWAIYQNQNL